MGLVAYGVFTHGLLSGTIRSAAELSPSEFRDQLPQLQGRNLDQNLVLLAKLREFAVDKGIMLPQLGRLPNNRWT
jgi:aryl-alcohol dehydrogenase-like predicted oxidoreductase